MVCHLLEVTLAGQWDPGVAESSAKGQGEVEDESLSCPLQALGHFLGYQGRGCPGSAVIRLSSEVILRPRGAGQQREGLEALGACRLAAPLPTPPTLHSAAGKAAALVAGGCLRPYSDLSAPGPQVEATPRANAGPTSYLCLLPGLRSLGSGPQGLGGQRWTEGHPVLLDSWNQSPSQGWWPLRAERAVPPTQ